MPLNYAKWDGLGDSSDDDDSAAPPKASTVADAVAPPAESDLDAHIEALVEQSKVQMYEVSSGIDAARTTLRQALKLLADKPCTTDAEWRGRRGWLLGYTSYQLARVAAHQLDKFGLHMCGGGRGSGRGSEISAATLLEAIKAAVAAGAAYARHFSDPSHRRVVDARDIIGRQLREAHKLLAEAAGPARHVPGRSCPLDARYVEPWLLYPLPGSAARARHKSTRRDPVASELVFGELAEGEIPRIPMVNAAIPGRAAWSDPGGLRTWHPQSSLVNFMTGPVCSVGPDDFEMMADFVASFDSNIDYPPVEMLFSCPGCNVRADSVGVGFFSLEYVSCFHKPTSRRARGELSEAEHKAELLELFGPAGWGDGTSLVNFNKLLPRCWCVRCVRDVVGPLAAAAGEPLEGKPPWAHLRATMPVDLPSLAMSLGSWQEEGDLKHVAPSVHCGRAHWMDHMYFAMTELSAKLARKTITGPDAHGNFGTKSTAGLAEVAARTEAEAAAGWPSLEEGPAAVVPYEPMEQELGPLRVLFPEASESTLAASLREAGRSHDDAVDYLLALQHLQMGAGASTVEEND